MTYQITVPQPCNESWAAMTPEGDGRHCTKCSKVVTDFTDWKQEDILTYIKANSATGVCGRFRAEQLDTIEVDTFVQAVSYSRLSLSRSIAAILLAAIGFIAVSCNTGNPSPTQPLTIQPPTGIPSVAMPPPPVAHADTADVMVKTGEVIMRPAKKHKKHHATLHEAPPIVGQEDAGDRYIMGAPPAPSQPMQADTSRHLK